MRIVIEENYDYYDQVTVEGEELSEDLSIKNAKKCINLLTGALNRAKELFADCICEE